MDALGAVKDIEDPEFGKLRVSGVVTPVARPLDEKLNETTGCGWKVLTCSVVFLR